MANYENRYPQESLQTVFSESSLAALKKTAELIREDLKGLDDLASIIADRAFDELIDGIKWDWRAPVNRVQDLPANDPQGSTRWVRDVGKVYRRQNGAWVEIQDFDANSVTAVVGEIDRRLTPKVDTASKDAADAKTTAATANRNATDAKAAADAVSGVATEARTTANNAASLVGGVDTRTTVLEEIEFNFEFDGIVPSYITNLGGIRNAVAQYVCIDQETNQMYLTQSAGGNPESFVITHLTPSGKFISSMFIEHGGHGTSIALDTRKTADGRALFWTWHDATRKLVYSSYRPNGSLSVADARNVGDYRPQDFKDNDFYFTPIFDPYNDRIIFRSAAYDNKAYVFRRNDVATLNNNAKPLHVVQIDKNLANDERPMQGIAVNGDTLYWQAGTSNPNEPMYMQQYHIPTGQMTTEVLERNFHTPMGVNQFPDDFKEPEGLTVHVDTRTGKKTLLAIMSTGGVEKRHHILYGYVQRGGEERWSSIMRSGSQLYPLTRADGRAHSIPDGTTALTQLTAPGYYYMTTAMARALTDFPVPNAMNSGWWLEVLPGQQHLNVRQVLTRHSGARKQLIMSRAVDRDGGNPGAWTLQRTDAIEGETLNASEWNNRLSNLTLPGEYYMTTPTSSQFTDHPQPNTAGWWLEVSSGNAGNGVRQLLRRASVDRKWMWERTVEQDGSTSSWFLMGFGRKDYTNLSAASGNVSLNARVGRDGSHLSFRGSMTISNYSRGMDVFTLPADMRPYAYTTMIVASDVGVSGVTPTFGVLVLRTNGVCSFHKDPSDSNTQFNLVGVCSLD